MTVAASFDGGGDSSFVVQGFDRVAVGEIARKAMMS